MSNMEHEGEPQVESPEQIREKDLTDQISTAKRRLRASNVGEAEQQALEELIRNAEQTLEEIRNK